jgi:MoaA/NifB/PqqE/SkfB family radical SAM enzyme
MYKIEDIKSVHLEITQNCQAACSMCDRSENGKGLNRHLNLDELTLADIKKIFDPSFIAQLNSLQICGNHGDPIIARDLLEIVQYFRENNGRVFISINTNAGARPAEWWSQLAKVLGNEGRVIFSVDGLEDTNHLYRQNVSWPNVELAMHSFIKAGGRARWDFLVFAHNEHQIAQAEELSKLWGFEKFILKKSARFITSHSLERKSEHQSVNRQGERTHLIKEPVNDILKNQALQTHGKIESQYGSIDNFYDQAEISCKVQKEKSIYVSAEGLVLPCCWTAGRMYKWWHANPNVEQVWTFINKAGGKDALNAKKGGIAGVFKTGIFQEIEQSWQKHSCADGKLKVCAVKCGVGFDLVAAQYK